MEEQSNPSKKVDAAFNHEFNNLWKFNFKRIETKMTTNPTFIHSIKSASEKTITDILNANKIFKRRNIPQGEGGPHGYSSEFLKLTGEKLK